jgi:hypothetical protein
MDVNSQHLPSAVLHTLEQDAEWAPNMVGTFWRKIHLFTSPVGIATRFGLYDPGDRISVEARFSAPVQSGPGAHPGSYTVGIGRHSRG